MTYSIGIAEYFLEVNRFGRVQESGNMRKNSSPTNLLVTG